MPCKHQILEILVSYGVLLPISFHRHWWIDRSLYENSPLPIIREPVPRRRTLQNRRGDRRRGGGVNSTRRQWINAEIID
jgi:hypothetical protein